MRRWKCIHFHCFVVQAKNDIYDCIRSKKMQEWELLPSKNCNDSFNADACSNLFPRRCCTKHNHSDKERLDFWMEKFDAQNSFVFVARHTSWYGSLSRKCRLSTKGQNKRLFEDSGDGLLVQNRQILDETEYITSTNCVPRTKNHGVATYEQTNKGFPHFYLERIVKSDGIQTFRSQV